MAESNEQLAERIQAGETGLMGSLWEQLERFFHRRTGQFYRQHEAACRYAGVEPEDLLQSCFIALHKAVQDYKAESGYKLTTYLHRHMQGLSRRSAGIVPASGTRSVPAIAWTRPFRKRMQPPGAITSPTRRAKRNTGKPKSRAIRKPCGGIWRAVWTVCRITTKRPYRAVTGRIKPIRR